MLSLLAAATLTLPGFGFDAAIPEWQAVPPATERDIAARRWAPAARSLDNALARCLKASEDDWQANCVLLAMRRAEVAERMGDPAAADAALTTIVGLVAEEAESTDLPGKVGEAVQNLTDWGAIYDALGLVTLHGRLVLRRAASPAGGIAAVSALAAGAEAKRDYRRVQPYAALLVETAPPGPAKAAALTRLAATVLRLERSTEALASVRAALAEAPSGSPEEGRARAVLAGALAQQGRLVEAEDEARRAVPLLPARADRALAEARLGEVLRLRGAWANALPQLELARADAPGPDSDAFSDASLSLGLIALAQRRPEAAEAALGDALKAWTEGDEGAWRALGATAPLASALGALLRAEGKVHDARDAFRHAAAERWLILGEADPSGNLAYLRSAEAGLATLRLDPDYPVQDEPPVLRKELGRSIDDLERQLAPDNPMRIEGAALAAGMLLRDYAEPAPARRYARSAGEATAARLAAYPGFDEGAQAELAARAPVFRDWIAANWRLAHRR